MKKSIFFILLTVLILGIFTACKGDVFYDMFDGGSEPGPTPVEILYIDADTTTLVGGKTYTIASNVTIENARLTIDGNDPVTILLPAGLTLNVQKGITVAAEQTLIIDDDGTKGTEIGTLIAGGYGTTPAKTAGIGGVNESGKKNAGTITINGGIVYATGGTAAAGIGGGDGGNGGKVTINGGKVTAYGGENAAGIGGGHQGAGGNVTITAGTVKAYGGANEGTGGDAGAGIGGGDGGNGGKITISGGTVTAKGGSGDMEGDGSGAGAGIGGGKSGDGGSVTINGGNVTAQGGDGSGVGIGAGNGSFNHGDLTIADDVIMMVSTNNTDWSVYDGTRTRYMRTPTILTSTSTSWTNGGVYTLGDEDVTIASRITVTGSATLLLPDGRKLTASKGITVSTGNSLAIGGTGTLTVTAPDAGDAGIGGGYGGAGGNVTINGGTVTAIGGSGNGTHGSGAGIGGGGVGDGGTVTITGGTVTAIGGSGNGTYGSGAGIGGGRFGAGGNVTINGGKVTATGGDSAAGIGAGEGTVSHGTLTIGTGVHVYKTGESTAYANGPQYNVTTRYQNMTVNNFN